MPTLDEKLERLRVIAGAEFAFALTREGALVTRDAPRDMPEVGRTRLTRAADVAETREVLAVSLPRGELVPYGGPGPIDISLTVVSSKLVVCLAMTSAEGRGLARAAFAAELGALEALVAPNDAGPSIEVRGAAALGRETLAAIELDTVARDAPLITVGPVAMLGRETLAAIQLDTLLGEGAPRITLGPAPQLGRETLAAIQLDVLRGEAPRIVVEPARKLGRETLAAIEKDIAVSGPPAAILPIPPEARRQTLPWIEPTADSERVKAGRGGDAEEEK